MNRCITYYSLSSHLDALLWCLNVCSQARSSQWRRFRVALPKLLIVWKIFLRAFRSIANWRYKWFVTKSVYLAKAIFLTGWKKRKQDIFCSRIWMCIFRAKWCTVFFWNKIHQKRFIRGGISSIATHQLFHCPSVGSNNMLCSNYFFTFVIMQVVLLNICLGQRWNAVMKSRLWMTPQPQRKEVKWGHIYGRAC